MGPSVVMVFRVRRLLRLGCDSGVAAMALAEGGIRPEIRCVVWEMGPVFPDLAALVAGKRDRERAGWRVEALQPAGFLGGGG